ncbi:hypothetical protein U14_02047 [Candidatus Moduliflexus flocculans]|uniref:Porin n=1 Tax=Candidatus Moduliflexus flocculans TaxID=1499966 RepID=A0A0S6VZ72_9BACT|nr:hypothetical protein U14_02047 [Candidatus Moduliflexus flocculans]
MKLRALFAAACAGLVVAPMAFAEVSATLGLSGDVETNTTWEYKSVDRGAGGSDDLATNSWTNEGRTRLKLTGRVKSDSGWFAAAQGDGMIATSGTTGVDDAWVQFGTSSFATKIGRYEFEKLMTKGEDVYIASAPTAPSRYEGNYMRGRFGGSAGNIGLDFKFSDTSKMQIGMVLGGQDGNETAISTSTDPDTGQVVTKVVSLPFGVNVYGIRPVFMFSGGAFTVKVGGEYGLFNAKAERTTVENVWVENKFERHRMGGAVDLSMNMKAMNFGVSGAYGQVTGKMVTGEDYNDLTQLTFFGWWKMAVAEADTLGLGASWSQAETDNVSESDGIQGYIVYIHQMPIEGLKIKFAGSYAAGTLSPEGKKDQDSDAYGVRMRINYDF